MGSLPAAPPDLIEEVRGDVTLIRTDPNLPPVAIIDRSPITTRHKLIFGAIAVLGAVAWAAHEMQAAAASPEGACSAMLRARASRRDALRRV